LAPKSYFKANEAGRANLLCSLLHFFLHHVTTKPPHHINFLHSLGSNIMLAERPLPLWKDSTFPWSLDLHNNETLESKYLCFVQDGIIDAAARYKLILPEQTLAWLDEHNGHYEYYIHPDSKDAREQLSSTPPI
jgi:hypothetical protein